MLTGFLRQEGVEVIPIDANVEAYDRLLRYPVLKDMAARIIQRLDRIDRKAALRHVDQLRYGRLREAVEKLSWVPTAIEDAVAVLRDRTGVRFFDPVQYETAIRTVQAALQVISAAYAPLTLDFTAYRTPFSLLTIDQIKADAAPARNPFHAYFSGELADRVAACAVDLIGISLAFPGQIQPGYSLACALRRKLPGVHITVGGPAATQMLLRLPEEGMPEVLNPFDSAVLFEGEEALLSLIRMLAEGRTSPRVLYGNRRTNLVALPPPDFEGLPMEKYLSPELVLPYDPTRGCYWGKCSFCHYGLSPRGTAIYRERPLDQVVDHLKHLQDRWGCRIVYFSQDAFLPDTAGNLAHRLRSSGIDLHWSTDMRPEATLSPEGCRDLKAGGALSMAVGIESASPRVLKMIRKGASVAEMGTAVEYLAQAGIAVEAMCFTDFPTETAKDARATLAWIQRMRNRISLFMCGRFGLCSGSRIAHSPEAYGIRKIWHLEGDALKTGLFYEECIPSKTEFERETIDRAIDGLSRSWWLHDYPWAGALSTAHTLLWYAKYGPDVFRRFAGTSRRAALTRKAPPGPSRFDAERIAEKALAHESEIWYTLIHEKKAVSRRLYAALCRTYPPLPAKRKRHRKPSPRTPVKRRP